MKCTTCHEKPAQKNGYCKECRSEYNRAWYAKNKEKQKESVAKNSKIYRERNREIVNAAKSVPCADCGGTFQPFQMDFDHISDDKEYELSKMYAHSEEKLRAEMAKCEVVCANCHRLRTHLRRVPIA